MKKYTRKGKKTKSYLYYLPELDILLEAITAPHTDLMFLAEIKLDENIYATNPIVNTYYIGEV